MSFSARTGWGAGLLTRPVRRPIEAQLAQWRTEASLIEKEGEIEEQKGRALAAGALAALILEIMDEVARNPELLAFLEDLFIQQGRGVATGVVDSTRGVATGVVDSTRSVTVTSVDAADSLLRRLLRRLSRR
jgi:hypothetical protein